MENDSRPYSRIRRVLLVGFMGSGKSTVGALLASRLGWRFVDFDTEVERRAGTSVAEVFEGGGEAAFRVIESEVGEMMLEVDRVVLATGGGWPAFPGRMERIRADTLTVWLQVRAETTVARISDGGVVRPLLQGVNSLPDARRLLEERRGFYEKAKLHLDADEMTPSEVTDRILDYLEGMEAR